MAEPDPAQAAAQAARVELLALAERYAAAALPDAGGGSAVDEQCPVAAVCAIETAAFLLQALTAPDAGTAARAADAAAVRAESLAAYAEALATVLGMRARDATRDAGLRAVQGP